MTGDGERCAIGEATWHAGTSLTRALVDGTDSEATEPWVDYRWQTDLPFDPLSAGGRPLPNNAMNLVVHHGQLFAGFATTSELGDYPESASYLFRKSAAGAAWELDATFEPGSSRIGTMASVVLATDATGTPLPEGPRSLLIAGTNGISAEPIPAQLRIRDREGTWHTSDMGAPTSRFYQVRSLIGHRDASAGADLVVAGVSPEPYGIMVGTADPGTPGAIVWHPDPDSDPVADHQVVAIDPGSTARIGAVPASFS